MTIAQVRIVVCQPATVGAHRPHRDAPQGLALAREFPSVRVEVLASGTADPAPTIDLARWNDRRRDFAEFDAQIEDASSRGAFELVVRGGAEEALSAAGEMLTRWQRLFCRRNEASATSEFDRVLAATRALHALEKPLVRADWNHALDTWQWLLRLQPDAAAPVQMAALLHDVERLESEADARIEHHAPDYDAFKHSHAARGAEITRSLLARCGVGRDALDRAVGLVAGHERPDADADRALLNDADALSFFSQNSAGYLDYFGPEPTRRKLAYTLGRMRPSAAERIGGIRLRADVNALLHEVHEVHRRKESTAWTS